MPARPLSFIFCLIAAACLQTTASGQADQRAGKYERLLRHLDAHDKFMGSVAISVDAAPIFVHQVGHFAGEEDEQSRTNAETQFRIGSISKTFTSVMILQLVEEGKLQLDTKLSTFYPELDIADAITIEQLLRHRSGLGSITSDPTYRSWNTRAQTREQMLKRIATQPKQFDPDERTEYSNTNYLLLGYIIERLSGNSYADELKTRIVDRIGLRRTAYASMASRSDNVAISYSKTDGEWKPHSQTDPSIPHGAGAIMSTPSDLVVFIENLFAGKLISESSLGQMTTLVNRMGLGIMQLPFGSKRAFAHNGGIDGFQSSLAYFPKDKVAIAVVGNGIDYSMNDIMIGLLTMTFGGDYQLPSLEEKQVSADKLQRYEGVYASQGFPLKITVKLNGQQLTAQATGQSSFPLTPTSDTEFKFDPAGIVISFAESKQGTGFDSLQLKQAGQDIPFTKED